jgi:peptide/nickel transport system substrate-binding protein
VTVESLLTAVLLLAPPAEAPVDTLVVGTLAVPVSLEPHRATDLVGAEIVATVCETLVRLRPGSLQPEGALAVTWATRDQRSWTFTLREGVVFHDGTPFDADAVVGNVEHFGDERAFPGHARRIGPHVVQITLDRANAALLSTLSQPFFAIQSPRRLEGPGSQLPVGTGPFRLLSAERGHVELEAFPDYWGGRPRLRRVEFRRMADGEALTRGLLSGEVDVSSAIEQGRVAELRTRPEITLDSQTGLNLGYLALNDEKFPFYDPRVRLALARAVDRARIVAEVLDGHGTPADSPLPPLLADADARARDLLLDRDGARRLLARTDQHAGFQTSLTVSLAPRAYLPRPLLLARLIQEDLAQVGVTVHLREVATWPEHVALTSRGDFEMALLGWQADSLDPNDFLTALLDSDSIDETNRSRYRSEAMDGLLKRARRESAPGVRQALYREAQALFQAEMPFVPLYHASVFIARRQEVHGLIISPTGFLRFDKTWKTE